MILDKLSHNTISKLARFPALIIPVIFIGTEIFLDQERNLWQGVKYFLYLIVYILWPALQTQYMLQMSGMKMRQTIIYDVALVTTPIFSGIIIYLQNIGYQIGNNDLTSLIGIVLIGYLLSVPASLMYSLRKNTDSLAFLFYFILFFTGPISAPFIQRFIKKLDFEDVPKIPEISLP